MLLHCCLTAVSLLLHCCFTASLFHCCFTAVSLLFHCFTVVFYCTLLHSTILYCILLSTVLTLTSCCSLGIFIRGPGLRAHTQTPQLTIHTVASVMVGNGTEAIQAATQECELVTASLVSAQRG